MRESVEIVGVFAVVVFPVFLGVATVASALLPLPTLRLLNVLRLCFMVPVLSLWAFVVVADAYLLSQPAALTWALSIFMTLSALSITWALMHLARFLAEYILYRFLMLNREPWLS